MEATSFLRRLSFFLLIDLAGLLTPFVYAESGSGGCDHLLGAHRSATAASWSLENFTDPHDHQDLSFRYIVHAGPNVTSQGEDPVFAFSRFIRNHDFNRSGFFSTSLISENHTATFSFFGVILRAPPEKVIAATPEDMRSSGAAQLTLEQGLRRFAKDKVPSPEEILRQTDGETGFFNSDLSWTEVLLYGSAPSAQSLQITGVFAHRDSLGAVILSSPRLQMLHSLAEDLRVPFVLLPPPRDSFVLSVRMRGERKPLGAHFMVDYGPQRIDFFGSEDAVRFVFSQAQSKGKRVRLVDMTGGPVAGLVDATLFEGGWWERWQRKAPVSLPPGTPPIELGFDYREPSPLIRGDGVPQR